MDEFVPAFQGQVCSGEKTHEPKTILLCGKWRARGINSVFQEPRGRQALKAGTEGVVVSEAFLEEMPKLSF